MKFPPLFHLSSVHNHFGTGLLAGPFCSLSAVLFPYSKIAIIIIIVSHPYCASVPHQPARRQCGRGNFLLSISKSSGVSFIWRRNPAEEQEYSAHGPGRRETPRFAPAVQKLSISQRRIVWALPTANTKTWGLRRVIYFGCLGHLS